MFNILKERHPMINNDYILYPLFGGEGAHTAMITELFSDPEVTKYLHRNTPFTTDSNKRVSPSEFTSFMEAEDHNFYYAICPLGDESHPIGLASLHGFNEEERSASLGIVLMRKAWSQGIGTDTIHKLIEMAKQHRLTTLKANVQIDNTHSLEIFKMLFGDFTTDSGYAKFTYKIL